MGNDPDEFFWNFSDCEQALFEVRHALERAAVDAREQRIIWHDGSRLSIEEATSKIHSESDSVLDRVQSHP